MTAVNPRGGRELGDLMDMSGRTSIVTGGAGHIGAVVADGLAELGSNVVLVDLDGDRARTAADDIGARRGVEVESLAVDLEDEAATRSIAETVVRRTGRLDVVVHAAALVSAEPIPKWTTPFAEQGTEAWRRALEVNLTSVFVLTQACAPALASHGQGSVITIGSTYGVVGPDWRIYRGTDMGNAAGYAASKGGLIQLTRWMATTLAPDIRVNCLTPGGIERGQPASFVKAYEERTPMARMATEEDYKGGVAYLASDLSRYVTGQNLIVDGGWTAW